MKSKELFNVVVGSDSLIGRALMTSLDRAGERVLGTTRRPENVDESHLYLDLSRDVERWQCPSPVGVAIICAGVTKIDTCRRDPAASARVNIDGVSAIVRNLKSHGAFVVYLSTNAVFDGSIPYRSPHDPFSPTTEYGRQKAAVEAELPKLGDTFSIVRFTKVVEPGMILLKGWLQSLRSGEIIHPFSDMVVAPVPLSLAVDVLHRVAVTRSPGIIQVSGEKDVTYAEVAYYIARRLGASMDLVQPVSSRTGGVPHQAVFANTTLDTSRLQKEFDLEPPDVWATIDSAVGL